MAKSLYTDPAYRAALAWWEDYMASHSITCRRCGKPIPAGDRKAWDLGHPAPFRPEHWWCNRSAGGREGRRRQLQPASREW